jgi:hypothetical protein
MTLISGEGIQGGNFSKPFFFFVTQDKLGRLPCKHSPGLSYICVATPLRVNSSLYPQLL